jgi:hypothetical protein
MKASRTGESTHPCRSSGELSMLVNSVAVATLGSGQQWVSANSKKVLLSPPLEVDDSGEKNRKGVAVSTLGSG